MEEKKYRFLALKLSVLFFLLCSTVFGATITSVSNDNRIDFGGHGAAEYVNVGNNSSIIGNQIRGVYYDNIYGLYTLNWSPDNSKNVHFTDSTDKCANGYGFKIRGKAKSDYAGFIEFNDVYYCESDNELHGTAYSDFTGEQDFEGIQFQLVTNLANSTDTGSDVFTNDTSDVDELKWLFRDNFDANKGSTFYIIK